MSNFVDPGAIAFNLVVAGLLTFIVGSGALVLLRRAILRHIAASGGPTPTVTEPLRRAASAPLVLAIENAAPALLNASPAAPLLRRIALAHAAAGFVFGILAALLLLALSGIEIILVRIAVVVWALAWPTVLVLGLLIGPDRRTQSLIVVSYLGVLFIFGGIAWLGGTPGIPVGDMTLPGFFGPALVWAITASPSAFLLLFLNRTIRTIGPLVLVFVFVLLAGSHVSLSLLALQPVQNAVLNIIAADTLGGDALFWSFAGLGGLAGLWPAWRIVMIMRDRFAAKQSSDLMLTVGAIWLLQSLVLAFSLSREQGALGAAAAIVPLMAWRLTLHAGLRPVVAAARARVPSRLLLLRVFGFGRRSRRLLDLLGVRWRLIGSIDLIAAPDLASRTVEPSTFIAFMRGHLARLFIRTPDDLQERLAALDHRPDPDGRFRVNQLFCGDAMWRDAVTRLMREASLVVMDLRGFNARRRGCVFELQTLLDTVPLERLIFLFDQTTEFKALESLLIERWQQLDEASPNIDRANPTLRLIDTSGSDTAAVRRLLAIAGAT